MLTELQKGQILKAMDYAQQKFKGFESGHDWWHTWRVWNIAKYLAKKEKAEIFICSMAALLHDVADQKFASPTCQAGEFETKNFLGSLGLAKEDIRRILFITENLSFGSAIHLTFEKPIEFQVVQDADRLEAIGAIGIARAFNYGGYRNRPIYEPNEAPRDYNSTAEYRKSESSSIMHFYEKLLKLKYVMNTATARDIAEERHKYLEEFLNRFLKEWNEFSEAI
jgi:uncharacterized protein